MRIGELADRTGVAPRLLRYYEEQGLLRPTRTPSGYRQYAEAEVDTVHRVRTLLGAGLSTATIAELLPCMAADGPQLVADYPELLTVLHRERGRLTAAINDLTEARNGLDSVIEAASRPFSDEELAAPTTG